MIAQLLERLNSLNPMSEELADKIISVTKTIDYPAGTYILKEGQTCTRACMIGKGLARSYYINDGKEITSRFMDEGFIITSWISYYTQKPGNEFIQTVEDCTLLCIDHADIQKVYKQFPEFNIIGRKQTEYAFYQAELRTQMLRKHTAEERYKFFIEQQPSLLQRVPLKHIATYLGMNEETLSRVRSRFHKKHSL